MISLSPSIRGVLEFLKQAWYRMQRADAAELAAALSFRTLFSLFPLLVVAALLTRAVLAERFEPFVSDLITNVGLDDVRLSGRAGTDVVAGDWMRGLVHDAASINLSALGLVGGAAVLFTAIWLMVAVESSFDRIVATRARRPLRRRLLVYWSAITLAPALLGAVPIGVKMVITATNMSSVAPSLAAFINGATGFLAMWLMVYAMYTFIPNRRIAPHAAALGSLGAALAVLAGKAILGSLAARSFGASKLFASLGVLPVLMFWIYLMWLVVLYGLQLAVMIDWTLPRLKMGALRHARHEPLDDPLRPRMRIRPRTRRTR